MSLCSICSKAIGRSEVVGLRPFVRDRRDPLDRHSDGVMHRACYEALTPDDPLRLVVESLYKPPHCVVCKLRVSEGVDGFFAGFLTSRVVSPAYQFNFCAVHDKCLSGWPDSTRFWAALRETADSPTWLGPEVKFENGALRWHFRRRPGRVIPL
jgi:hypothetical protein